MDNIVEIGFNTLVENVHKYNTAENRELMVEVAALIAECFRNEKKVLICGNGGSNCDAVHFAEEFTGRFRKDRCPLPVIAISDSSHITCVGNDYGFAEIFARGVDAYGQAGDIFIGISTSGNSENVKRAVLKAEEKGMVTIGLLGKDGGMIKGLCDHALIIPGDTTDRIQEVHMTILHIIIELVERQLFPELYE